MTAKNAKNDDTILEILQGHKTSKWPMPKLVKIFIASTKHDFAEERKLLLEFVGPELQIVCNEYQIEVELVDMHYGANEADIYDPELQEDFFEEIRACHRVSRGCFFMTLIGNKYSPHGLPYRIEADLWSAILKNTKSDILQKWYQQNGDEVALNTDYKKLTFDEWRPIADELRQALDDAVGGLSVANRKYAELQQSIVERQFHHAIGLAPGTAHRVLTVLRELTPRPDVGTECRFHDTKPEKIEAFRQVVEGLIPEENRCYFKVPWTNEGIDPENNDHEQYLTKFKNTILTKLQAMLLRSIKDEPDLKSRKKIVEENFQENITHLTLNHFQPPQIDFTSSEILDKIKNTVLNTTQTRHPPIIIHGNSGSGKTALLKTIYTQFETWFSCKLLRIVRSISRTPRSSYSLELLRVICQQICIALKLPEGFLPKDASFDPLYINNWFQTLLRMFEDMNQVLVIFLDDLDLLNPLDSDLSTALSWLPISLPKNCYLICTSSLPLEHLKLTQVQKEKMKMSESSMVLPGSYDHLEQLDAKFTLLEETYGSIAIKRLSSFITCAEYGLTETELLEMLMPISNVSTDSDICIQNGDFNFATLCAIRRKMDTLIYEKLMSGKILIEWRHQNIKRFVMDRYLKSQETLKSIHTEIANMFFSEFCDEENSESEDEPAPLPSDIKETPFQSTLHSDVTYSLRHVEESWIHLLKAGDILKLKTLTMCNYDFMLASVHTISVSYLRCVLEHVRCYLLDREIELIYHAVRKATEVLTRDTYQLGTQIIAWLRPVIEKSGSGLMNTLVTSAMAWCDGFTLPLVVPLTDWVQPILPAQSKILNTPDVRLIESTPNGQHVICCSQNEPELWHIMSNTLVHTFKGHTSIVVCMTVTKQSQYLITGSDDLSIIVWDLRALTLHLKICEHIAPVLCITSALNNSVIVSGGEDSSIIVTSLSKGNVVTKIDHHRGPVTTVKVTSAGDVLVSGSRDATVCLWSLETFTILNTIQLQSPVRMIDVSSDSVFLLTACMDNNLYLRTLATGTELHSLSEHKSRVKSICLAQDSCRAVVGCSDGRVYIYDVHSGKLARTLSGQQGEVTAVRVTDKDDFLLTAGGSKVLFYPFRSDDNVRSLLKLKKSAHHLLPHTGYITCIEIARDGLLSATGASDNLVNIWQLNTHELLLTLNSHSASITDVSFAPNTLFVASSSEDKTVKVWGLTLGSLVATFKGHQAPVSTVMVMMDSTRIISSDRNDTLCIWLADNGNLLQSVNGPSNCVGVTNNMKYAFCTNAETTLKIWSLVKDDEKYTVSHSEDITCFVITMDSLHLITGSRDMSLKVWQASGGKLSQVLIGHTDAVTCVAVSAADKNIVISGSCDCNLIVWDMNTGADIHTLSAHLSYITCVKCSGDGTIAISGSDDKSIIIWDTKRGLPLTSLQMHSCVMRVEPSSDLSRISVMLKDTQYMPIICLHNTPAKYVKLPTYCAPEKDIIENPTKAAPKRQLRRLLKKEVSLDTYTWQKKYAHLTSNLVIPAVDERFKRRFSVSASMEEISKIPQKDQGPGGMPNKQGSLAQSQHFDQLEALWNKRSPPRRKLQQSLSKQSSLAESHADSSEEDQFDESSMPKR